MSKIEVKWEKELLKSFATGGRYSMAAADVNGIARLNMEFRKQYPNVTINEVRTGISDAKLQGIVYDQIRGIYSLPAGTCKLLARELLAWMEYQDSLEKETKVVEFENPPKTQTYADSKSIDLLCAASQVQRICGILDKDLNITKQLQQAVETIQDCAMVISYPKNAVALCDQGSSVIVAQENSYVLMTWNSTALWWEASLQWGPDAAMKLRELPVEAVLAKRLTPLDVFDKKLTGVSDTNE